MSWSSSLVRLFGHPATLIHGDTLVLDRWHWLKQRLPLANGARLLDVGCGTGAFTIGAALRGYSALGLSWDERNNTAAKERARLCRTDARFEIQDVRKLDQRKDLAGQFDVVISCENIEHVLDDAKLMRNMIACLKPGGRLLLTTPNYNYKPITQGDNGPWSTVEDGGHVRKGYTENELRRLCPDLECEFSWCSGVTSQKVTYVYRLLQSLPKAVAWVVLLPLRPLPLVTEPFLTKVLKWPYFSICMEARKPC